MEQSSNIEFCMKVKKSFIDTFKLHLNKVYGNDCLSCTQVKIGLIDSYTARSQLNTSDNQISHIDYFKDEHQWAL